MNTCTKHPHSSAETASKCHAKYIQRRLDARLGKYPPKPPKYAQVRCNPPEEIKRKDITIYYFYKGVEI